MKLQKRILLLFLFLLLILSIKTFAISEGDIITYDDITVTVPGTDVTYEYEGQILEEDPLYEKYTGTINTPSVASDEEDEEDETVDISTVISTYAVSGEVTVGIDVSAYQGTIDWEQVASSGVTFAIIRVGYRGYGSEGNFAVDSCFERNIQGALDNGIKVGIYFFSTALNETEALEEAVWVQNLIQNYNITYPVAYDFEYFGEWYDSNSGNPYRTNGLTTEQLNSNAAIFLSYLNSQGYIASLYGSASYLNNTWSLDLKSKYDVWVAHYTTNLAKTTYSGDYTMWQCTSKGSISGISGYVDIDIDFEYYPTRVYRDVRKSSWYYDYVMYCYENGLMTGYEGTSLFGPNDSIKRGALVLVLYRMAGSPGITSSSKFTDVKDTSKYYYKAIVWAAENGIVTGYGNTGLFKPENLVTREELTTMLYRYANYKGKDVSATSDLSSFTDSSGISSWAQQAIKWAVGTEIITGIVSSDGSTVSISPSGSATRAQVATMIYRYCNL